MTERAGLVRRGFHLSVFTVSWNVIEGIVAITAGILAGSVALLGFGFDSFIESTSGIIVGWRFYYELGGRSLDRSARAELRAARIAGILLIILAIYLVVDSLKLLFGFGPEPDTSRTGIVLTVVSLIIMPFLAKAKLKVAERLGSRALRADAYETIACAWLSLTTLAGLILNAVFGWWWADPAAALVLVPLIVKEGWEALRGEDED